MEETLTYLNSIKFVATNVEGGGGSTPAISDVASASSVSTGDFIISFVIAILCLAAFAVGAIFVLKRKKVTVGNASILNSVTSFKKQGIIIAVICFILACSFALFVNPYNSSSNAVASESQGSLVYPDIVAKVDMQTGDVNIEDITIVNDSEYSQSIDNFGIKSDESVDLSGIEWTVYMGDTVVYKGEADTLTKFEEPIFINGHCSKSIHVDISGLTTDRAKNLAGKKVASSGGEYKKSNICYYGSIMHPSDDGTYYVGVDGALVSFVTPEHTYTCLADTDGNYKFVGIVQGTTGQLSIFGPSGQTWTTFSKTIDKTQPQEIETVYIAKIQSLKVNLFQNDKTGTAAMRERFWCPVFADGEVKQKDIVFYDKDMKVIDKESYSMSDLYDSTNKTSNAQYFSILTINHSLHCYQTCDTYWNDAFVTPASGQVSTGIKDSFWNLDTRCSDPLATTVYFNGEGDASTWCNVAEGGTTPVPTLNGIEYSKVFKNYGGCTGGVFSLFSDVPWSAKFVDKDWALCWANPTNNWMKANSDGYRPVILSHTYLS